MCHFGLPEVQSCPVLWIGSYIAQSAHYAVTSIHGLDAITHLVDLLHQQALQ